jgi:hypothetical protein|tara:strand:- start:273 stop:485 length:213 start_codon:yes stop_codon:yes gene_type:complete
METLKLIALIYGVGFIAAYTLVRLSDGTSEDWQDVGDRVFLSLLSWVGVFILVIALLSRLDFFKKPPRWL